MRTVILIACAAMALSGCYRNDTEKAVARANYDDSKSWHVTCVGYQGLMYDGNSRGPVTYDENGRVSFIDAQTGKMIKSEGECVQVEL
jgi:hypothetical protein